MKVHFDQNWQDWIRSNLDAGHNKDGIFKILLDEGYDYQAIKQQMNYEPSVPAVLLVNPLKIAEQRKQEQLAVQHKNRSLPNLYLANARRFASSDVELYSVENFLSDQECQQLVSLIEKRKQPSTITSSDPDQEFRTSSTCHLGNMDEPLIRKIDLQICQYLGIDPTYSEVIQGQHYEVGQQFKAHTDYFEKNEIEKHGGQQGQRTYTFMIYLNNVEQGGDTLFPKLGIGFKPKPGMAVIWNNLDSDGKENYLTLHQGSPVQKGCKVIITKWFRQNSNISPAPPVFVKEINEYVPAYTEVGFARAQLPEALFDKVSRFYQDNISRQNDEHIPGDFVVNAQTNKSASNLIDLPDALRQEIHDVLLPMMEAWCGQKLQPTYVYGIRVYQDKAMLKTHRDRYETHIISAIINVAQDVNQDWPLQIDDNYYRQHQVILKPGEMFFYEGARLLHGRPIALDGSSFANIFCHFKPIDYRPELLSDAIN